ncbi:hypothetical protein [Neisseria bacilliformis]|uniref:hypothetical protein n=1 Tax=Neisseria bacilliformis TaxID=267212 RepID=UPI003C79543A
MALKIAKKAETDAQWCVFEQDGEAVARFLIRPIDEPRYQVAQERLQMAVRAGGLDIADIAVDAKPWVLRDAEAVARYLVADWDGLEDAQGNALAYSPDMACEVFAQSHVGLVLWAWAKSQAEALQERAEREGAEAVKKPSHGSGGTRGAVRESGKTSAPI